MTEREHGECSHPCTCASATVWADIPSNAPSLTEVWRMAAEAEAKPEVQDWYDTGPAIRIGYECAPVTKRPQRHRHPAFQRKPGQYANWDLTEMRFIGLQPVQIQLSVARHFGLSLEQLRAKERTQTIAVARNVAVWLCRHMCGLSYPELGEAFGRHHTSCLNAVRRVNNLMRAGRLKMPGVADG